MPAATFRLDQQDPLQFNFEAAVIAAQGREVTLDRSAFYPAGGGQNADWGWLRSAENSWQVEDTRLDKTTGTVWHRLAEGPALPSVGTQVAGQLDRERRLRQMARHTGEHLLAQAFWRLDHAFEVAAVAMRGPDCTLDLKGFPGEQACAEAEALLREALVGLDLRLRTLTVPHTELGNYRLRRPTSRTGAVRLVIFEDVRSGEPFDVSACAGVHLPFAAMCGPVTVLGHGRIKAGLTRVTFRAGPEAGELLSARNSLLKETGHAFSTVPEDVPARVAALLQEQTEQLRAREQLESALAEALMAAAPLHPAGKFLLRAAELPAPALLTPALGNAAAGEVRAAFSGERCGVGVGSGGPDAGGILRAALTRTGGKGGGRGSLAQGVTAAPEDFLEAVKQTLAAWPSV